MLLHSSMVLLESLKESAISLSLIVLHSLNEAWCSEVGGQKDRKAQSL